MRATATRESPRLARSASIRLQFEIYRSFPNRAGVLRISRPLDAIDRAGERRVCINIWIRNEGGESDNFTQFLQSLRPARRPEYPAVAVTPTSPAGITATPQVPPVGGRKPDVKCHTFTRGRYFRPTLRFMPFHLTRWRVSPRRDSTNFFRVSSDDRRTVPAGASIGFPRGDDFPRGPTCSTYRGFRGGIFRPDLRLVIPTFLPCIRGTRRGVPPRLCASTRAWDRPFPVCSIPS